MDGVRGAAALAVVLFHAFLFTGRTGEARTDLAAIGYVVGWGYLGVPLFIVLSGYVLMLPILREPDLRMRGGAMRFLTRRARRILPPYYGALAIVLALIAFVPVLRTPSGTAWDSKLPVTVGGLISHLLLLHDASPHWIGQIDGPLWSVAVEWQIYFVMPLVLLPLWRRVPAPVVVALVTAAGLATARFGPFGFVHLWFVGLFAAGMWAAQLTVDPRAQRWLRPVLPAGCAVVAALAVIRVLSGPQADPFLEVAFGLTAAVVLALAGRDAVAGRSSGFARVFGSRPLMRAGLFSYSLYLLHSPLLGLANLLLLPLGLPVVSQWAVMTFVVVPLDVAVCLAFFWLVERRFLNTRQRHAVRSLGDRAEATG